jgi:acetyl esterase/lipase
MIRAAISAMGTSLGPNVLARCRDLFDDEQSSLAAAITPVAVDLAYGPHPRHRLDIYAPAGRGPFPVLVFVHGGGFVLGDKGSAGNWANANVGRMAARAGFVGVVINYRLAPECGWPAGSEDVAAAVHWLKANLASHGGDPAKIVLAGTSAGAVHLGGYLKLERREAEIVRGMILLSGLYGYTQLDDRDVRYYGDPSLYPARMPLDAVATTGMPLLLACAELDPPRFQSEFLGLMQDRLARHGVMPRAHVASGHNHYSMAMHLGTSDTRLSDEIIQFVREVTAP